jgi:hypothetical protein
LLDEREKRRSLRAAPFFGIEAVPLRVREFLGVALRGRLACRGFGERFRI